MNRSTKSQRFSDRGSAPVEFVLVVAPIALLLQLLSVTTTASLAKAASIELARDFAQSCALADTDATGAMDLIQARTPKWLTLQSATCVKEVPVAKVALQVTVKNFWPTLSNGVIWHATSEPAQ